MYERSLAPARNLFNKIHRQTKPYNIIHIHSRFNALFVFDCCRRCCALLRIAKCVRVSRLVNASMPNRAAPAF